MAEKVETELLVDDEDNLYVQTTATDLESVFNEAEVDKVVDEAKEKGDMEVESAIAGLAAEVIMGYFPALMASIYKSLGEHYDLDLKPLPDAFQIEAVDTELLPGFLASQEEEPDEEG